MFKVTINNNKDNVIHSQGSGRGQQPGQRQSVPALPPVSSLLSHAGGPTDLSIHRL